jgi:hypothetical protein
MTYLENYIQFIKTFLINSCYIEYNKEVYKNSYNNTHTENVVTFKYDKDIWDTVFCKVDDLLMYYLSFISGSESICYSQNKLSSVYNQFTFQEYVDSMVNFQEIGYREYQKFIRSMQNSNFKKNIFNKYQVNSNIKTLKNHIIYIIHLYLSKRHNYFSIFS